MSSGYSGTPLIKKLGIKKGCKARFIDPPEHYADLLGSLPDEVIVLKIVWRKENR